MPRHADTGVDWECRVQRVNVYLQLQAIIDELSHRLAVSGLIKTRYDGGELPAGNRV